MDTLRHGACVLKIDILRSDLNVEQSCLDISVTHELHERRQADAFPHHVRGKCVSETMRVGEVNASRLSVIAEQGTQTRSGHACAARSSLERNEQRGATKIGSFQPQILIDKLNGFRCQGKKTQFAAFAADAELAFGK